MILFCEECGQRNSITLTPALIETNSFTCRFCGFRSPFPFLDKERKSTSSSTAIVYHPTILRLSPAAKNQESSFILTFHVEGIQEPLLTLEPFSKFSRVISINKTTPESFTIVVKALGKKKNLFPTESAVPALIFCEDNLMNWGTVSLLLEAAQEEEAVPEKSAKQEEKQEKIQEEQEYNYIDSLIFPSLSAVQEVIRETKKEPPSETKEEVPQEIGDLAQLQQQVMQYKAQLQQIRTKTLRMQKELSIRRQVMDNQHCGILFIGPEQRILYANAIFLSNYGCTLNAIQTKRLDQLIKLLEPLQNFEDALKMADAQGTWQGTALLQEVVNQKENLPLTISLTRSIGEEGQERGFTCLLFPQENRVSGKQEPLSCLRETELLSNRITYDTLTGLADRPSFQQYLEDSIQLANAEAGNIGLLYIDLDHFKRINRIFGPGFGDKILCSVSTILQQCGQEVGADLVARLSGDEFAIILPPPSDRERAQDLAERIMQRFSTPLQNESRAILIRPSIGFGIYPDDGKTPLELLRNTDAAMEAAKGEGGNRVCAWNSSMKVQAAESLYLENDLRQAVANDELINFYQPQINLTNGSICGMEALARWVHPTKGMISPAAFIPLAEDTGLIEKLGIDLVRKACLQGKKWWDMGFNKFVMAVNLSGRLLRRRDLFYQIMSCVESTGFPPDALEVEFTEGVLIENMDFTVDLINKLRAEGVKMAIDDFGTGYSSLSYLQHLKVDKIKIDRSFITNVTTNKTDAAITLGVISIGKNLGFKVIAEGIETEEHLFFLQKSRCDEGQGYLFSTPISDKDMTGLLLRDSSVALNHKRMLDKFYSIRASDRRRF